MEVTQQFLEKLRHNLNHAMAEDLDGDGEIRPEEVLSAFDRAALATVLNGSEPSTPQHGLAPGSAAAKARARKAAATRAKNKQARAQDPRNTGGEDASTASHS